MSRGLTEDHRLGGRSRHAWGDPSISERLSALRELSTTFGTLSNNSLLIKSINNPPVAQWFSNSRVHRNPWGLTKTHLLGF